MNLNDVNSTNCFGKILKSKGYGDFRVLKYNNCADVEVEFLATGFTKSFQMSKIKKGAIKDPFHPSFLGVGILGDRYPTTGEGGKHLKHYEVWSDMLKRCYSHRFQKLFSTYYSVEASDDFKFYPYFYEWCEKQVGFNRTGSNLKSWCLDKDILVKGNKVYSADTCCFVPNEINCLFTKTNKLRGKYPIGVYYDTTKKKFISQINRNNDKGCQEYLGAYDCPEEAFQVYKKAKELYIKEVAERWKDQIDPKVYNALISYEVEITD